jgi:hypothetical protein
MLLDDQGIWRVAEATERLGRVWHGPNHAPKQLHRFPDRDTSMLVDIVLPAWVPLFSINLSEDLHG